MHYEVSRTDYLVLVSLYRLFDEMGYGATISRSDIVRESGLTKSQLSKRVRNKHLLEKGL